MPDRVIGDINLKVGFGEELSQCGLKSYIVEYLNAYNIPYSTDYSIGQMITLLTEKINSINPYADCGIVSEPQRFYGNYDEAVIVRDIEGTCTIPGAVDTIEQKVVFTAGDIVINGEDNHYWMAMVDKPESEPTPAGHLAGEWCDITDMCEKFDLLFPFTIEYDSEGVPHIIEGRSIIVRVEDLEACCVEVKDRVTVVEDCCDDVKGRVTTLEDCCDNVKGRVTTLEGCCASVQSQLDVIATELAREAPTITKLEGVDTIDVGDTWTDAGATADDNGTDVTSSIVVTGSVDNNTAGTYTITYCITNSVSTACVDRIVTVGDAGTGTGTGTGVENPTITLNGESILNLEECRSWVDDGATAVDGSGNDVSDSIVVTGNDFNTCDTGNHVVSYCITDSNGDTTCVERTVIVEASSGTSSDLVIYFLVDGGTLVSPSKNNVGEYGAAQDIYPNYPNSFSIDLGADGYPIFENYRTDYDYEVLFDSGNQYTIPRNSMISVPEDLPSPNWTANFSVLT